VSELNATNAPAKPPFWRDPEKRALAFQIVFLAIVLYIGYSLVNNTMTNLASQGIASGFGFLSTNTGFAIAETLIDYNESSTYLDSFFVGLLNTILVSVIGIFFATILGFSMGIARLSNNWLISRLAAIYVDTLRNIPLLLQLFFWYFAVLRPLPNPKQAIEFGSNLFLTNRGLFGPKPIYEAGFGWVFIGFVLAVIGTVVLFKWARKRQEATGELFPVYRTALALLIGLPLVVAALNGFPMSWDIPVLKGFNFRGGMSLTPEFSSLVFALSIYTSSFIAEIVRSGILAVDQGQTEAAFALGIKPAWTTRLVVVPQALRVIIPPLTSQYLNLTKNSSLAAAIAYPDLVAVFAGTALNQVGQAVEIMGMTLAVYLFLSLTISFFMNWYNSKMALVER
jgi:general L-amino acid transport system permease protein|tara:strand:- start:203 stop:1390 length:1188 start_codon:yes stop_codon:yes gene_type:complete